MSHFSFFRMSQCRPTFFIVKHKTAHKYAGTHREQYREQYSTVNRVIPLFSQNEFTVGEPIDIYSGENKYLNPCRVWPLAKKCVIYNCNGRCILTVRNRISTNKSRKLHFMTLFVFDAENKYLNPQANSKNSGSQ